ncbi:hypothetical protein CSV71_14605 [Sporosarcina sp. P21c]|uniref:hypothetical protein n=1 Tax=unclassified Sporosarcina TaxID=2647733 RepID=UPI000C165BA9|nr:MULTISPECIES: hypothetical protein [unclassified Sporosarcina]PIC66674.1 hypothetical protein CSV78_11875 [Sporosarcina sp. P16a]PIC88449.1 hypothetical protein CSV71_14605 [Sporosarcina sp. P21c]PIC91611.1 hypothetical protein CSV70_14570 [Sporosarcina sp. P25]
MNLKAFLLTFIFIYILISLPAIFGIGHVIDWVSEATVYQKFKGYVIDGLLNNFLIKTTIASVVGVVVIRVISKRRYSK